MVPIKVVSYARKPGHLTRGVALLISALASVSVVACADLMAALPPPPTKTPFVVTVLPPGATELSFETLYESYTGGNPSIRNPTVAVVAGRNEFILLDPLLGSLLNRLRPSLEDLDYSTFFVLVALRGHTGCGVPIEIKQIIRQGDTVHIYAYLPDFPRGQPCPPEATYPYHLVKVRKDGTWNNEFTFILYDNDRLVAETKHFIP